MLNPCKCSRIIPASETLRYLERVAGFCCEFLSNSASSGHTMAAQTLSNGLVQVKFFDDERIEITQLVQLAAGTRHELSRDKDGEPQLETFYKADDGTVRTRKPGAPGEPDAPGAGEPAEPAPGSTGARTFFGLKLR